MPDEKRTLPFIRRFSSVEYERLLLGLIPQEMEDRWFVYLNNDYLFFHRSWTGYCIFELRLDKIVDGCIVIECFVNGCTDQYEETDDTYNSSLLSFLIDTLMLGKNTQFPSKEKYVALLPGELGDVYTKGNSFRARAEARQREYRASVLKAGWYRFGHILDKHAAFAGYNFCSPVALKSACIRFQKKGVSPRTFQNMLSSQAMCFNIFAPLQDDKELAHLVLTSFFPTISEVREIIIEYTPDNQVFKDQSGVGGVDSDVLIRAKETNGNDLVIVIETKFVETEFSICGFRKPSRKSKGLEVCPDDIDVVINQHKCLYVAKKNYGYWERSHENHTLKLGHFPHHKCPFSGPLWQLWVNHTLAHVEASKMDGRARSVAGKS